jgi:outer membrane assembly lipoprotein YfiO
MTRLRIPLLLLAAAAALLACVKQSPLAGLTVDEIRTTGLAKMDAGEPAKAREYFEALVGNSRADAAEAEYLVGMTYYRQKLYEEAYVHFGQVIDRYPASEWCDDAQLMKGEAKLAGVLPLDKDQLAVDEALDDFTALLDEYESSTLVGQARDGVARCRDLKARKLLAVGSFYAKTGKCKAAAIYFDVLADEYAEFPGLAEALFRAGECYERLGEKETAAARYRAVVTRFPASPWATPAAAKLSGLTP